LHGRSQAVPDINLSRGQEDLLKVGVGITTGWGLTATVGSNLCKDYTVMGDVANIAARIQGVAAPGEIIVTDDVYEQIGSEFPDAEMRELELRGISHPVTVHTIIQTDG
jgi:class 3 adenylate cyclase